MRLPFSIFRLRTDRTLHFMEEAQSLADAKARVQKLAELSRRVHHFQPGNGRASLHYRRPQTGLIPAWSSHRRALDRSVQSRISSVNRLCNFIPAAPRSVRIALAVRPSRPITLPKSSG